MPQLIMFLIILVLIAVVVARNVVIVPQAAEYVVERLGSTAPPGKMACTSSSRSSSGLPSVSASRSR